jgi:hypothetical protein
MAAASCEIPVKKAIPYLNKPDTIVPGVPNYYASTCIQDNEVVPVVVKVRDGRPIKLKVMIEFPYQWWYFCQGTGISSECI